MITGINHLGIATNNVQEIRELYRKLLPLSPVHEETIEEQGVKVASFMVGGTHLEFMEPLGPESPIKKFMEKHGTAVHHIAFTTDGITGELERLKEKGFRLIDESPRTGFGGKQTAFAHPKSTGGILIELCEENQS
ncbi:MAG: methylmalonyl-CoA epimerase [Candidatus Eremiobacteraeota bacterium]|nr:methylmalonyl-CoA epimerase [Candidatus Eremiobacteraeota bacterium]